MEGADISLIFDENGGSGLYTEQTPSGIEVSKTVVLDAPKRPRGRPKKDKTTDTIGEYAKLVGFRDNPPPDTINEIVKIMSTYGWNPWSEGSYTSESNGITVPDTPTALRFACRVMQALFECSGNVSAASAKIMQPYHTVANLLKLEWFSEFLACVDEINIDVIVDSVRTIAENKKEDSRVRLAAYKELIRCHESKVGRLQKSQWVDSGLKTININEYLGKKALSI